MDDIPGGLRDEGVAFADTICADAEAAAEHAVRLEKQRNAIVRLPEAQRWAMKLRHVRGLATEKIAKSMGVPINALSALLGHALQKVETEVRNEPGGPRPGP